MSAHHDPLTPPRDVPPLSESPLWEWFGLSYAAYAVLPRVVVCSMPRDWQERQRALLEELEERLGHHDHVGAHYDVRLRDDRGRFRSDPLSDYRHHPILQPKEAAHGRA